MIHIMCGSMVDIQSATAENRRKKKKKKKEATVAKYNGLPFWAAITKRLTLDSFVALSA